MNTPIVLLEGDQLEIDFSKIDFDNNHPQFSICRGCSRKKIHPSKKRREKGRGTAYIECKPITKNGLEYKQYWFHWQVWRDGETTIKKSRYIPKRLVPKVERMNGEKVAVRRILEFLGVKD